MAVQIQIREETVQACLSGEIDHHSAAQMREKIDESVIQSGAKTLVLDFSLVTFMDSSGIGLVMGRFRLMQENGGELVLQKPACTAAQGDEAGRIGQAGKIPVVFHRANSGMWKTSRTNGGFVMKAMNTMRLCFDSRSCNEAFARTAVAAFLCGLDPTVEELSDVKTAVSEAVTNCIVHGYRSRIDKVYLTATIGIKPKDTAPWVVIRIRDKGCGIEDVHKAMEPLFTTAPEEERAGLGFAVMESLMDRVKVVSHPGKGTTVTLEKRIVSKAGEGDAHR